MTNLRTGLSVLAVTAAVTAGGIGTAAAATHASHGHGQGHSSAPCSIQQAQVDRAQAKLDALTAKFAAAKAKVRAERQDVAEAKGSAKGKEKKALAAAKATKAHVAKDKKAQVQRLAKATARLENCLAGVSSTATPTGSASVEPSETATVEPSESASARTSATPTA